MDVSDKTATNVNVLPHLKMGDSEKCFSEEFFNGTPKKPWQQ
jgi:hypothetical protein